MRSRVLAWLLTGPALVACEPAEDVAVLPLPPLESASPEARAGLPEISGSWRFAGWELAPGDTARAEAELPALGELRLETQRLDSIAGFYVAGEGGLPLVGEVRRDSVISLAGQGRFLAGRIGADTLWLSLTTLMEPGSWPDDARAAFVRSDVEARFVRVKGQRTVLAVNDSVATDSMRIAAAGDPTVVRRSGLPLTPGQTMGGRVAGAEAARRSGLPLTPGQTMQPRVAGAGTPARPAPGAEPAPQPAGRAGEAEPRVAAPPQAEPEPEPREERTSEPVEREPQPEPEPEPETRQQPRPRPRLLGEPIDSVYSPTALRAISRPGRVSASR